MMYGDAFEFWWNAQGPDDPYFRTQITLKNIAWEAWKASAARPSERGEATRDGWQPIATAPKEADIIITDGKTVSQGGWVDEPGAGMIGWWSVDGRGWTPTHWQPLPSPYTSARIIEEPK